MNVCVFFCFVFSLGERMKLFIPSGSLAWERRNEYFDRRFNHARARPHSFASNERLVDSSYE